MAKRHGGLGKGLDAIFVETQISGEYNATIDTAVTCVRLSDIEPDKKQPRKLFNDEALKSLADSISTHGVLQPLVIRSAAGADSDAETKKKLAGKYRIISGERRWRAAKIAGLIEVPVVVRELSDTEAGAVMLVENLQREDLNPVETANGLKRLIEEFGLTHEETAKIVGISRPKLTNSLRLLALPFRVLEFLETGDISAGHARTLLPLENQDDINDAIDVVLAKNLSVRDTEKLVKNIINARLKKNEPKKSAKEAEKKIYYEMLQDKISSRLGRKTFISDNLKKKDHGKLEIEYYGNDDLEILLKSICGENIFDELND